MLIKLTNATTKDVFVLSASIIWAAERDLQNKLVTKVMTSMQSPKGLLTFDVMESPEDICDMVQVLFQRAKLSS